MPENYTTDDYLKVFAEWGTPRQIRRLHAWATPEEWEEILREAGSPKEVLEAVRRSKRRSAQADFFRWAWAQLIEIAKWMAIVATAIGIVRAAFPNMFEWWKP